MAEDSIKVRWFRFRPSDWIDELTKDDNIAGKDFKTMIVRLFKREAPEDSIEKKMIIEADKYYKLQKEKITKRWEQKMEQDSLPAQSNQEGKYHKFPKELLKKKSKPIPTLDDLYDFCDDANIPIAIGREWYDYMADKGWQYLNKSWQSACRGFFTKKQNSNSNSK